MEVTKLSLLLKVLEGESDESLSRQMRLLHERVLPDLGRNIKCGNSGAAYFDIKLIPILQSLLEYKYICVESITPCC